MPTQRVPYGTLGEEPQQRQRGGQAGGNLSHKRQEKHHDCP